MYVYMMSVCVCMYVCRCVSVCMCASCQSVWIYECMSYIHTHTHIQIHTYSHTNIHTYTHTCIHTQVITSLAFLLAPNAVASPASPGGRNEEDAIKTAQTSAAACFRHLAADKATCDYVASQGVYVCMYIEIYPCLSACMHVCRLVLYICIVIYVFTN